MQLSTSPTTRELGLSDDELDTITTGTLQIGDRDAGAINVSADITRLAATNITLSSGGAIAFGGGMIDTGGGNLLLAPGNDGVGFPHAGTAVNVGDSGTLRFASGTNLVMAINGLTADSEYDQLNAAAISI